MKYRVFVDDHYHCSLGMSFMFVLKNWDRCQYCGYAMGWTVQGSIPDSDSDFYLLQNVHTGSGTNPASYSRDIGSVPPELTYEPDNSHLPTAKDKNK